MSIRNMQYLFDPRSVAIVGASEKPHSAGAIAFRNLVESAFKGDILTVNPKYGRLSGRKNYQSIAEMPVTPDLAIICTPPSTIPGIIAELGARGTKAALVLTGGLDLIKNRHRVSLKQAMLDAAKPYLLRILGADCIGLQVPAKALNAGVIHSNALRGQIAFVSQSGAVTSGVLDWARSRGIGFSKIIALGDSADVDLGDVLDYLDNDADTMSILLYVDDVRHARKFMSAARGAARSKPVLIVKAGRGSDHARVATSLSGALVTADAVYDAAIRRAGMLRVLSVEDMFGAVETLARVNLSPHFVGEERLIIVSNGGGPGVMATDALISSQRKLASLSNATLNALNGILPNTWSHDNPIDILGDAPAERYRQTLEVLLQESSSDAILLIFAPTAFSSSADIVGAIVPLVKKSSRNILVCCLGGDAVAQAKHILSESRISTYDTPEEAVQGFMQIVQYRRNQNLLMQVPSSIPHEIIPDRVKARAVVTDAMAVGRQILLESEAKAILEAYGIPVSESRVANNAEEAVQYAQQIGFPVALKIISPDIFRKPDIGGVMLDLETPDAVSAAAKAMSRRLYELLPDSRLRGFSVHAMERRPGAMELTMGVTVDATFGPVILFGQGGAAVEIVDDHAVGLPPLNNVLARDMVSQTRVAKLLAGYENHPSADMEAIYRTLIQISHLVIDIPEIVELDINPLLVDHSGVVALDVRMRVVMANAAASVDRLAIRPYPQELEELITWQGQSLLLRPIKPEDGQAHVAFFAALNSEDVHNRMFTSIHELQPSQLARMTQIDYDREMGFIATRLKPDGEFETLGIARAVTDPDNVQAEFAIIVRSDLKGQGLGPIMMEKLIYYCRRRGTQLMVGDTFSHNTRLIGLVKKLGFGVKPRPGDNTMQLCLDLCGKPPMLDAS